MKKLLGMLIILAISSFSIANAYTRKVCASHILVPTEMEAIKIKSQIKTYDDFQYYAKNYSQCPSRRNGGDLGCFGRGEMVKPFEDAAFEGNIGEISDPIQTQFGYHLIWVTEKY